jgi:hypothetical protein
MCKHYAMTPKRDDVDRFFRLSHKRSAAFEPMNKNAAARHHQRPRAIIATPLRPSLRVQCTVVPCRRKLKQ